MVHKDFLWLSFFLCKMNIFSKEVQIQTGFRESYEVQLGHIL